MIYLSQDYVAGLEKTQTSRIEVDFASLPRDPNVLFAEWFERAVDEGLRDVSAVSLATVDELGLPEVKIVDILHLDSDGFHFGTGKRTATVKQLEMSGAAALNFWWQPLRRSVRVKGTAQRKFDGERLNMWCIQPEHFEFFQLWGSRENADKLIYRRDELGDWERIPLPGGV